MSFTAAKKHEIMVLMSRENTFKQKLCILSVTKLRKQQPMNISVESGSEIFGFGFANLPTVRVWVS